MHKANRSFRAISGKIWPIERYTIKLPRKKNIFQEKILPIIQNSLNIAPSSFCVYLFGLESLAAPVRDFCFMVHLCNG